MEEILKYLLLVAAGTFAGFINTMAGGGSLLTLPTLIFMGLPSNVANATNRLAILTQNISATLGFKSKGVSAYPFSLHLGLIALAGSLIGAFYAVDIKDQFFNRMLSIIMVLVLIMLILKPSKFKDLQERTDIKHKILSGIVFFFIGIYGGFIQVGVGYLIMITLTYINRFSIVKTNSAKVFIVLIYNAGALAIFIYYGLINWKYGLILALGNSTGAWIGSRWSTKISEKKTKIIISICILGLAIKLWIF